MRAWRAPLLLLVIVGGVCAVFFFLSAPLEPESPSPEPGDHGAASPGPVVTGTGEEVPALLATDPARIREDLLSPSVEVVREAMARAERAGPAAPELIPTLEEVASGKVRGSARRAMLAIMRIEGSRRYLWELARVRPRELAVELTSEVDPVWGPVLAWIALRWQGEEPPPIRRMREAILEGPAAARSRLLSGLAEAGDTWITAWLTYAEKLPSLPPEIGPTLARRLGGATAGAAHRIEEWLVNTESDLTPIRDALLPALLGRLPEAGQYELSVLLPALGSLGIGENEVLHALLAQVREATLLEHTEAIFALKGLERLGRAGAAAAPDLVALYPEAPHPIKPHLVTTLGAIASPVALPLFHDILTRMDPLAMQVLVVLPAALVRLDPELAIPGSMAIAQDLLGHEDSGMRARMLEAIPDLRSVPDEIREQYHAVLVRVGAYERRTAIRVLIHFDRNCEDVRAFAGLLMPIASGELGEQVEDDHRAMALRALAKLDPFPPR